MDQFPNCPVCLGNKVVNNHQCTNCGGQTMGGMASGKTFTNIEGNPCKHTYQINDISRCYREYVCTLCPFRFPIDSGD